MNEVSDRLPYDHDKFVDREEELATVEEKARRIAAGSAVERRVVIFHGQRGAGKTWLLQELEHRLRDNVHPHFIDLSTYAEVTAIGAQLAEQRRPLVLLLDNVNEASESYLDRLLEQVLAPLVREDDVLIVLAERGRPHFWPAPEFREKSHEVDLEPFESACVEEQVRKQVPETAAEMAEVESLGGGYPWSTYTLAWYLPDRLPALERCAALFLEDMDEDLRPYFEALSILRAFDETRIGPILQAYSLEFANRRWDYAACRTVRADLVTTTLARWDGDARGYVLDEPLRLVLEAALRERERELWVRLHCTAYRLYQDWAESYPQSRAWWEQEARHHTNCLAGAGLSPADCPEGERQKEGEEGEDGV